MKKVKLIVPMMSEYFNVTLTEEVGDDFPLPDGSEITMMGEGNTGYSTIAEDPKGNKYLYSPFLGVEKIK